MSKLQKVSVPDVDVAGNRKQYHHYQVVVPTRIISDCHIDYKKPLYAKMTDNYRKIVLSRKKQTANSKQITLHTKRTRHYKGVPYYVTKLNIPMQFVKTLHLKKGDKIEFNIQDDNIIISR